MGGSEHLVYTPQAGEVADSSRIPPALPLPVSAWRAFWAAREDIGSLGI
jgi:hypothetical protein